MTNGRTASCPIRHSSFVIPFRYFFNRQLCRRSSLCFRTLFSPAFLSHFRSSAWFARSFARGLGVQNLPAHDFSASRCSHNSMNIPVNGARSGNSVLR